MPSANIARPATCRVRGAAGTSICVSNDRRSVPQQMDCVRIGQTCPRTAAGELGERWCCETGDEADLALELAGAPATPATGGSRWTQGWGSAPAVAGAGTTPAAVADAVDAGTRTALPTPGMFDWFGPPPGSGGPAEPSIAGKVAEFSQAVWGAVSGKGAATIAGGAAAGKTDWTQQQEGPAAVEAAVESGVTNMRQASMFSSAMPWVAGAMALLIGGVVVGVIVRREGV
jgi:hypothetical protein